jgi:dolichol-phosphate mannosyltransferase
MASVEEKFWPRAEPGSLSFVIPVHDEEEVLSALRERLEKVSSSLAGEIEWIFVDDGSRDGSLTFLRRWADGDRRVKVLELARNFGHQAAVTAGLDHARGDVVVVMDGDLQDPPELVLDMLEKYREGWDVVYAKRRRREGESVFKRATAAVFYWVMRTFVHRELPLNVGDFRLMTREATDALGHLREGHRFLRGMVAWLGFCQTEVLFDRPARALGRTKFSPRKMFKFAWDAMLSFSSTPLRLGIYFGALVSLLGVGLAGYSIVRKLLGHDLVPGWPTLVILQCTIGGYVGRIYDELKRRPLYIVRRTYNLKRLPNPDRAVVPSGLGAREDR